MGLLAGVKIVGLVHQRIEYTSLDATRGCLDIQGFVKALQSLSVNHLSTDQSSLTGPRSFSPAH